MGGSMKMRVHDTYEISLATSLWCLFNRCPEPVTLVGRRFGFVICSMEYAIIMF
ncbi:hypothetical protein LOK49_Contig47G00011 [Camellia lanceoleosa]|nr:hypothetical protein LOK49_Contig47G00011 [Camellia lanceoleosa]